MEQNKKQKQYEQRPRHTVDTYHLILLNDDVNDFDYVIRSLVEICGFDYEKAEQCTLLTHLKGEYPILSSEDIGYLEKIHFQFSKKNIGTKIK